ncbi:MAG: hypothetical protein V4541_12740 [Bacteroidota bacterium]
MKKLFIVGLCIASIINSYAQDNLKIAPKKQSESITRVGRNEFKFNILYTVLGLPEFTYERIIKEDRAIGLSVFIGAQNDFDFKFGLTPYYRWYFGNTKANGFFIEANTSMILARGSKYDELGRYISQHLVYGVGAATGVKFFTRNDFFGEAYLGLGRTIGERYFFNNYPRLGLNIGKRTK